MVALLAAAVLSQPEPLVGAIRGASFAPTEVELQRLGFDTVSVEGKVVDRARKYHLEFEAGDERILVIFTTEAGTALGDVRIVNRPYKFNTEEYRAQHYRDIEGGSVGRGIIGIHATRNSKTDMPMEQIACMLTLTNPLNGWVRGGINMKLQDGSGTWLRGHFTAKYEDLSDDE